MLTSLVILGCSQRKRQTSRPLPAIDRYDGPVFRVFRKHSREGLGNPAYACILSARFGLVPGDFPVPRYNRLFTGTVDQVFRALVKKQLKRALDEVQPERLFVSVGCRYWPVIEEPLTREVPPHKLVLATGSIGGRASQLAHWLRCQDKTDSTKPKAVPGKAILLGTMVQLSRAAVLRQARNAMLTTPTAARRFETWYVAVGQERVAPKWLVSVLFGKPVARFRTADARRVLSLLGVDCTYACRH